MDHAAEQQLLVARVEARHRPPPAGADRALRAPPRGDAVRHAGAAASACGPVLVLAAARLLDRDSRGDALPAAVAVECVHTYSLVHDDLPCMDNDDLRRGRPTAHRAFDEATALLAGDALLTRAFGDHRRVLRRDARARDRAGRPNWPARPAAAGSSGGQMEDLLAEKGPGATPEMLNFIHLNKTAAMIEASLAMGGLCAGAPGGRDRGPARGGRELGLAFQIVDDVLDATSDTATLGKTAGKDARAGKATYVSVHGIDAARSFARDPLRGRASRPCAGFPGTPASSCPWPRASSAGHTSYCNPEIFGVTFW